MTVSENISVGIKDILITFLEVKTHKIDAYTPAYDSGAEIRDNAKRKAQTTDAISVKPFRLMTLPFKVEAFNEEAIQIIDKDLSEIERHLLKIQQYMISKGYSYLSTPTGSAENIVIYGLDSKKPINVVSRNKRYFYWATDKRKLYALFPVKREGSPKVTVGISEINATLTEVFYTTKTIAPENISASISVSVSLLPA